MKLPQKIKLEHLNWRTVSYCTIKVLDGFFCYNSTQFSNFYRFLKAKHVIQKRKSTVQIYADFETASIPI